ncbi:MAG: NAD-dependent DNA ligase LigA [Candidatus Omnitrophota bacterium]|nr:MAG: NAD-dependent DNA ligase LigA [Candidatus Omnitrophota bacterium]
MSLEKVKKEIESLRELIRRADYQYYILSEPEISDKDYDDLVKKLKSLEGKYPQFIVPDSPTQRVSGGIVDGFSTVRHKVKMLSLDNTYSIAELKEWEEKIKRMLKRKVDLDYMAEPKIDGVSCSLTYEKGILRIGSTRGDGQVGEDVTTNIKTIRSIPLHLRGLNLPEIIEVRGEVYMKKTDFEKINQERTKAREAPFANPRNATSGSLKLLDSSLVAKRSLECLIHSFGLAKNYSFKTHKQFLEKVKLWGLPTDSHSKWCKGLKEVIDYCLYWEQRRDSFQYEVDGVVVKVNALVLQDELGTTLKSPRWMVAYKFPAHQATTKVERIDFGVGRTGIITPVAILKPVECGGVTISRTTLHNFDEVRRLDVHEGDTVLIERAGEVIPKVVKVITSKRSGKEKAVRIPSRCPVCKSAVAKEKEEEVYWYCTNIDCPAQLKRSLIHFASRGAMDIEGMGESVIEELVNRKVIKSVVDIYVLTKNDFLKLPLFKEKKANNIIAAIEKSKDRSLARFLYGLGIKHVGEKAASLLAERFKNIRYFFQLKKIDLEGIPEIGPIMASSIVKFFSASKAKKMIEEFKKAGVNLTRKSTVVKKGKISGKTFIFTGELKGLTRSQAQRLVEENGGRWVSSMSKSIDFVVVGENPGSKYAKAKKLELKIIDEAAFKDLIKR